MAHAACGAPSGKRIRNRRAPSLVRRRAGDRPVPKKSQRGIARILPHHHALRIPPPLRRQAPRTRPLGHRMRCIGRSDRDRAARNRLPERARRRGKTYAWQNPRELPDPHRAEHLSRAYRNRRGRPARVLPLFCRFARKRVRTRRARGVATNQRARVLDEKRRRQARPDAFRRNRQARWKIRRRCGQRG